MAAGVLPLSVIVWSRALKRATSHFILYGFIADLIPNIERGLPPCCRFFLFLFKRIEGSESVVMCGF
jgi:hypothetical protein